MTNLSTRQQRAVLSTNRSTSGSQPLPLPLWYQMSGAASPVNNDNGDNEDPSASCCCRRTRTAFLIALSVLVPSLVFCSVWTCDMVRTNVVLTGENAEPYRANDSLNYSNLGLLTFQDDVIVNDETRVAHSLAITSTDESYCRVWSHDQLQDFLDLPWRTARHLGILAVLASFVAATASVLILVLAGDDKGSPNISNNVVSPSFSSWRGLIYHRNNRPEASVALFFVTHLLWMLTALLQSGSILVLHSEVCQEYGGCTWQYGIVISLVTVGLTLMLAICFAMRSTPLEKAWRRLVQEAHQQNRTLQLTYQEALTAAQGPFDSSATLVREPEQHPHAESSRAEQHNDTEMANPAESIPESSRPSSSSQSSTHNHPLVNVAVEAPLPVVPGPPDHHRSNEEVLSDHTVPRQF